MNIILEVDRKLFLLLNSMNHPDFDGFMLAATDMKFWIPFYLWFIFILFKKLDQAAWIALCCISLTVLITDQVSSSVLKPLIERLRPSHEPELIGLIHLVNTPSGEPYRGGNFGFPSSHAANAFGVAIFLWLILGKTYKWTIFAFPVAAILAYSRIYLGVHYPLDIVAGIILGATTAIFSQKIFHKITQSLNQKSEP